MNIKKYWPQMTELYFNSVTPPQQKSLPRTCCGVRGKLLRGLAHKKISGGLLHEIYKLQTSTGNFALKILDPWIVSQDGAEHWNLCEKIANDFVEMKIPTISAIKNCDGKYVSVINNNYFLIYPWIDGKVLQSDEITIQHAQRMGELLGKMHKLCHPAHAERVAGHRDLDPRNIIWQNDQPIIIDWEYAGLITPSLDLLIVACNFSGLSQGKVPNKNLFQAVLNGYKNITGKIPKFTQQDYMQYLSYCLDWIEFNFRRAIAEPEKRPEIQAEISKSWKAIRWIDSKLEDFLQSLY